MIFCCDNIIDMLEAFEGAVIISFGEGFADISPEMLIISNIALLDGNIVQCFYSRLRWGEFRFRSRSDRFGDRSWLYRRRRNCY